jgi:hypothetical protein
VNEISEALSRQRGLHGLCDIERADADGLRLFAIECRPALRLAELEVAVDEVEDFMLCRRGQEPWQSLFEHPQITACTTNRTPVSFARRSPMLASCVIFTRTPLKRRCSTRRIPQSAAGCVARSFLS